MKPVRVLILICTLAVAFGAQSLVGRSEQAPSGAASGQGPFDSLHFRPIGPASMSGRITDLAVYESNPAIFYVGTAHGGALENDQRGHDVRSAVPGPGVDVDRRRHGVAEQSRSRLGRHRRVEQPPEHKLGRRRLQVDRRRQDVHEHGPQDLPLHQPHRHRPAQQRHRPRRGDRQPLRARRRTRHLQDHRRRQDLEADAEGRRRHRRERPGDGCDRQQDSVRLDVPAPAHRVLHERRRSGQRRVEVDRRRRHLEEAHRGAAQ